MREIAAADPSRTIRIFSSFQEQEEETVRFWKGQNFAQRMEAVKEMAEFYARQRRVDIDAQGPKRITRRVPCAWS